MQSVKINPLTRFTQTVIFLLMVAASLVCIVSCSKNKDDNKPATTKSDLLKQKWNLVKELDTFVQVSSNSYNYSEYTGKAGDSYEYRTYGSLFIFKDGTTTSDPYEFTESTMSYTFYGRTYKILVLTNNKLEVYFRSDPGSTNFLSQHVFLER